MNMIAGEFIKIWAYLGATELNVVNDQDAIFSSLSTLKKKNKDWLIFGNLNINSINNIFDQLKLLVERNTDVLVMTESKLDETSSTKQFCMDGYPKCSGKIEIKMAVVLWLLIEMTYLLKKLKLILFLPI